MKKMIEALFVKPTNNLWLQLFRYGFVGGIAFLADYGSLYALTEFAGIHHLVSAAISFIIGLVTNYLLSISWVFKQRDSTKSRIYEFLVFAVIGVIGLGLNEIIIYLGTDVIHLHYMLSKLISTAIVFFFNFFARRIALFSSKGNSVQ